MQRAPQDIARSNRRWLLIAGALFACTSLCTALGLVWVGRDMYNLFLERDQPEKVVQAYYQAIQAQDWARAQQFLSASVRASTPASALESAWKQREQSNGTVTGFAVNNTSMHVYNGQRGATISGAVGYSKVAPEPVIVRLVKEGNDWKLAALP